MNVETIANQIKEENPEAVESLKKFARIYAATWALVESGLTNEEILAIDAQSPHSNELRTKLIKSALESIRGE